MKETYSNSKSLELFKRAVRYIPTGIPGHLGPVQSQFIPANAYPFYVDRVKDSYFWSIDGNKYIDYMCAYGPNILGYNNDIVDKAANEQLKKGNCMALPAKAQVDLAELLCNTIEIADWAFFLKNGGDATAFAVLTAKAATGRNKIVRIQGGYHGVAPWTQAEGANGITKADLQDVIIIPWNDAEAFEKTVAEHKDSIACFIATPYDHRIFADNALPVPGYWQKIREICTKNGIVLIVDDVRCGFRLHVEGSAKYFGFKPDLACYCKALANGYNISAVVGIDSLKSAAGSVFFTGSYWSSAVPMAAAIACITEMKKIDIANLLIEKGKKFASGMIDAGHAHGIDMKFSGVESMPFMRITNDPTTEMMQDFCAECVKRGVFFVSHHNHFMNASLTDADIKKTIEIADEAFAVVARLHPDKVN
ncbi:MAG: aminotransferase class III-fold pyridoxal phosphate-dependent enzyme [Spirochaetia bacterium]|nr:aminotransferase class III-fold pyridoxal phosphate-dependent enzyme [Spirochaetia bacterium]